MKAYIFPGQGAQRVGMGNDLLNQAHSIDEYLELADNILGYPISKSLFEGTAAELKQTSITQPVIFLYSVLKARISRDFHPDMVAGHSLGEFSALVACRALRFADGIRLVAQRANAMQKACDEVPSGMAAVLGLEDEIVEDICASIKDEVVVPANYNCPGQLVISGTNKGLTSVSELLKDAGARAVLPLRVNGAFHSPIMEPARLELATAIEETRFRTPKYPIYQNYTARPTLDPEEIKENLIAQLTAPVKWAQTIENMILDGAVSFTEVGPKAVLSSMIKKINSRAIAVSL